MSRDLSLWPPHRGGASVCCLSTSSKHLFEHLGDAVVAGCGCAVGGGADRVWMTA